MGRDQRRTWLIVNLALTLSALMLFLLVRWLNTDFTERITTDWTAFDNAASRLWSGSDVYRPFDAETEPLPYLYPPFALWLALPLRLVGFVGSYVLAVSMSYVALLAGVFFFVRSGGEPPRGWQKAVLLVAIGGVALSNTVIGQYGGVLVLAYGASLFALSRGREGLAGLALALLCIKPNIAIAVPVVLVWSRSWRTLFGFGAGFSVMLASTIPFGLSVWSGWIGNISNIAEIQANDSVPFDKMITIQGALQDAFGLSSSSPILWSIWLVVTGVLGVAVLSTWRRSVLEIDPMISYSALMAFTTASNVRLYFYDGTIFAVAFLGLWIISRRYEDDRLRSGSVAILILGWVAAYGGTFLVLNRLAGLICAACALVLAVYGQRALHSGASQNRDSTNAGAERGLGASAGSLMPQDFGVPDAA